MPCDDQTSPKDEATARQHRTWRAILDGPVGRRALQSVRAIADTLRGPGPLSLSDGDARSSKRGEEASLAAGRAGEAVLYAYLAEAWSRDEDRETAAEYLEDAIEAVAEVGMPPSLYAGFTGVAWAASYLDAGDQASDAEDPNQPIDEALKRYLEQSPWQHDYDLIRGLVGFGVYALERLPRRTAAECLKQVIDHLHETAEASPEGVAWRTAPELLVPSQRQQCPEGYWNLGVAHGVPGVIALLGGACAAGVGQARGRSLLDGAVAWLLTQRLPEDADSIFPYWIAPGVEPTPARSAWCYGDPGIAATLLYAARCVGEPTWEQQAIEIARVAAKRPPEKTGVTDACLCHGAAGLGHLYNRMFQATGELFLKEAAWLWFERALKLRRADRGIAGFSAWRLGANGTVGWVDEPGFLSGAAGIALALLAATTNVEPVWDRVLLVSIPPRQA